jgi:hypothetical protein
VKLSIAYNTCDPLTDDVEAFDVITKDDFRIAAFAEEWDHCTRDLCSISRILHLNPVIDALSNEMSDCAVVLMDYHNAIITGTAPTWTQNDRKQLREQTRTAQSFLARVNNLVNGLRQPYSSSSKDITSGRWRDHQKTAELLRGEIQNFRDGVRKRTIESMK